MMYFFVSTPPKMFCMVSPAFSATSVKLATGLAASLRLLGQSLFARRERSAERDQE